MRTSWLTLVTTSWLPILSTQPPVVWRLVWLAHPQAVPSLILSKEHHGYLYRLWLERIVHWIPCRQSKPVLNSKQYRKIWLPVLVLTSFFKRRSGCMSCRVQKLGLRQHRKIEVCSSSCWLIFVTSSVANLAIICLVDCPWQTRDVIWERSCIVLDWRIYCECQGLVTVHRTWWEWRDGWARRHTVSCKVKAQQSRLC